MQALPSEQDIPLPVAISSSSQYIGRFTENLHIPKNRV